MANLIILLTGLAAILFIAAPVALCQGVRGPPLRMLSSLFSLSVDAFLMSPSETNKAFYFAYFTPSLVEISSCLYLFVFPMFFFRLVPTAHTPTPRRFLLLKLQSNRFFQSIT
jgi:hypothetical protein